MALQKIFISIFIACIVSSCIPSSQNVKNDVKISVEDVEFRQIVAYHNTRNIDALYPYLRNQNPAIRYNVAKIFASIRDSMTLDSLYLLLNDPIIEVKGMAAYAIGQIGAIRSADRLILAFKSKDTLNVNNSANAHILEAVGKTGNTLDLKNLATIRTYRTTDTFLITSLSKAIFRMALRGITDNVGTDRMVDILYNRNNPYEARLYAAYYLSRAKNIDISGAKIRLTELYNREENTELLIPLAIAIGKTKDLDYLPLHKTQLLSSSDYRLKVSVLKALAYYNYVDVKDVLLGMLKNDNLHISSTAAETLKTMAIEEDIPIYKKYDTITTPWQVRAPIIGAILKATPLYYTRTKEYITTQGVLTMNTEKNIYGKAQYLKNLCSDPYNYGEAIKVFRNDSSIVMKMASLEALASIIGHPLFFKAFGNNYTKIKSEVLSTLIQAINSDDVGLISTACDIITKPELGWREWIKDVTFMVEALKKLKPPKDIEAMYAIEKALSYLQNTPTNTPKNIPNYVMSEDVYTSISDTSIAAVKTSKGLIRIKLWRESAPISVSNFIDLSRAQYYNDKIFHRIVPNFVIQVGCDRGDGYGALDYSILTEVPDVYYNKPGLVGMASAGPDTESSQWFITHVPTPHLDGKYTIIGEVVEGMDVVHKIQAGDKINEIIIVK